jgi:hypothetical protein
MHKERAHTAAELLTILSARQLKNGQVVFAGVGAPLHVALDDVAVFALVEVGVDLDLRKRVVQNKVLLTERPAAAAAFTPSFVLPSIST